MLQDWAGERGSGKSCVLVALYGINQYPYTYPSHNFLWFLEASDSEKHIFKKSLHKEAFYF